MGRKNLCCQREYKLHAMSFPQPVESSCGPQELLQRLLKGVLVLIRHSTSDQNLSTPLPSLPKICEYYFFAQRQQK